MTVFLEVLFRAALDALILGVCWPLGRKNLVGFFLRLLGVGGMPGNLVQDCPVNPISNRKEILRILDCDGNRNGVSVFCYLFDEAWARTR